MGGRTENALPTVVNETSPAVIVAPERAITNAVDPNAAFNRDEPVAYEAAVKLRIVSLNTRLNVAFDSGGSGIVHAVENQLNLSVSDGELSREVVGDNDNISIR